MNGRSTEDLARAFLTLNDGEWPETLGEKPEDFEEKSRQYCWSAMAAIESIIGRAEISRYKCCAILGMAEGEWFRWYLSPQGPFRS